LKAQIHEYLSQERNDGNKIYLIRTVSSVDGVLEGMIELRQGDDVFVGVDVQVDPSKHVKPL